MKVLIFALLAFRSSECARILGIFPTPSISHQVVYHALMKDLAERGHQLTILTTDLIKINNSNVTQIDLHDSYEAFRTAFNFVDLKERKQDEADLMESFMPVIDMILDEQLKHPEVKKLIEKKENKEFDVIVIEYLNYDTFLAFAEIYNCPVIGMTSMDLMSITHGEFGNEINPVIHPELLFPFTHGQLTFTERWRSLKFYFKNHYLVQPRFKKIIDRQLKKHFPNVKSSIKELKERVQFLMSNANPAMDFIRPLVPNTIQLGFMHIEPPKTLPNGELKTFLDNSKNGVIYMSLGSNVQSKDLGPEIMKILLSVFGSLSYNVLWKFEADHLPNKPDNVMISKWLPQSDLLAHPAIKLFITQGGQQSMEEAIDRAVPMIVIPFIGDQEVNAKRMERKGIGKHLELHTLTQLKLTGAINEMLKPKYKKNIEYLRVLVNDQPMTSRERAVWWTEYVIRHKGAKHLEYPGRLVPFYQRYWLDFIGIAVFIAALALTLLNFLISKIVSSRKCKQE